MTNKTRKFLLYTRIGCHLCEDMQEHLTELKKDYNFQWELRDVDSDAHWLKHYNELVPLLEIDGEEVCRYFMDQKRFLSFLNN